MHSITCLTFIHFFTFAAMQWKLQKTLFFVFFFLISRSTIRHIRLIVKTLNPFFEMFIQLYDGHGCVHRKRLKPCRKPETRLRIEKIVKFIPDFSAHGHAAVVKVDEQTIKYRRDHKNVMITQRHISGADLKMFLISGRLAKNIAENRNMFICFSA